MNINIKVGLIALGLSAGILGGCKKDYLNTAPSDAVTGEVLFETTSAAYIALNGIHTLMITSSLAGDVHRDFGAKNADLSNDLMGNDVVSHDAANYDWFHRYYNYEAPKDVSNEAYNIWLFHYRVINNANAIINAIDGANGSQADKNDIKGQALAYRAWAYHRLVTRFSQAYQGGDNEGLPGVPIYTTAASGETQGNPRGTIKQVVDLMTADINQAIALLEDGATTHTEKSHINANVAHGIAARIAMYKWDYPAALSHAKKAMAGYTFMSNADFGSGLNSASNPEFMWCSTQSEQQYQGLGIRSWISFVDKTSPGYAGGTSVFRKITRQLYESIPNTDRRKQWWLGSASGSIPKYQQIKFRTSNPESFDCDVLYMRVAEMYLIAAEAAAELDNLAEARSTLQQLLASRIPGTVTLPTTKDELLEEIRYQRRVELWLEGFSQTDLKERGLPLARPSGPDDHTLVQAEVLNLPKYHAWFTFKIPLGEINANPNISQDDQNPNP